MDREQSVSTESLQLPKSMLENLSKVIHSEQIQKSYPKLLKPAYFFCGLNFAIWRMRRTKHVPNSFTNKGLWASDWQRRGLWTVTVG